MTTYDLASYIHFETDFGELAPLLAFHILLFKPLQHRIRVTEQINMLRDE
jgi:hypothetical protein